MTAAGRDVDDVRLRDWSRLGIRLGGALLERLAERAGAEGITRFSGTALAENHRAVHLVEQLGAGTVERESAEARFEVELPERAGLGSALGELLRAIAAGMVAPVPLLAPRSQARDE